MNPVKKIKLSMDILGSRRSHSETIALFRCQNCLGGIPSREYWGAVTPFLNSAHLNYQLILIIFASRNHGVAYFVLGWAPACIL